MSHKRLKRKINRDCYKKKKEELTELIRDNRNKDIVEYCEDTFGVELFWYQKILLRMMDKKNKVMGGLL